MSKSNLAPINADVRPPALIMESHMRADPVNTIIVSVLKSGEIMYDFSTPILIGDAMVMVKCLENTVNNMVAMRQVKGPGTL